MAELKTKPSTKSVKRFLEGVADDRRRRDCQTLVRLMTQTTRSEPRMWGPSIVGFGHYHYPYASGREGDWFLTGFSPRKQALTLYVMSGFKRYAGRLEKLGRFKTGKSCLYVKTLDDIDFGVLKELIQGSVQQLKR